MNLQKNILKKIDSYNLLSNHLKFVASDNDFKKLLQNKSVALVGPADYLLNSNFGKEIDSYDLVVRINRGIELIDQYHKDIGKRTDILYSCLIEEPMNAGKIDLKRLTEDHQLKFVCTTPFIKKRSFLKKNDIHPMADKEKFKNLSKLVPTRIISNKYWKDFSRKLTTRPTTGYISIFDILEFEPKKLKIFGFSFYMTSILKGYKKGMQYNEENFHKLALKSKRHEHYKMLNHAKDNLLFNAKVFTDPFLEKLLNKKT